MGSEADKKNVETTLVGEYLSKDSLWGNVHPSLTKSWGDSSIIKEKMPELFQKFVELAEQLPDVCEAPGLPDNLEKIRETLDPEEFESLISFMKTTLDMRGFYGDASKFFLGE